MLKPFASQLIFSGIKVVVIWSPSQNCCRGDLSSTAVLMQYPQKCASAQVQFRDAPGQTPILIAEHSD